MFEIGEFDVTVSIPFPAGLSRFPWAGTTTFSTMLPPLSIVTVASAAPKLASPNNEPPGTITDATPVCAGAALAQARSVIPFYASFKPTRAASTIG